MRLVRFAVRNPHWVVVFALIVALLGGVCAFLLPKDILPTFKTSAVQVVTFYPGMPAEIVEKDITTRLERWTGQSIGIARQESRSMLGVSIVKDFFRPDVDPNTAMSQVTSFAMSDLFYLPPGTIPPMVMPFDPTATVPLAMITVQSPDMDEAKLYDVAYFDLRNMLQGVSGVIAPAVYGGTLRRILAYVDPRKMAARDVSSLDVVNSLRESNVLIPTGDAKLGDKDVQVVTDALAPAVGAMNDFPIRAREGVEVRMKDVASVEDSHQIQTNIVRINGRRQVYIPIYRQPGANTIEVVEGIKTALKPILERLPKGIQLEVAADQSVFVRRAIGGLSRELVLGGLLASAMVLLFLGSFRSALAIFISIPLSILACLVGLYAAGDTLNAMTLGGLALAVGRLIDDSIVVLENTARHVERGTPAPEAALKAAGEVAMPVLAATAATMIVFLPVFFLTGMGKFLFAPLAKAVAFSIGASYLVAMTVVPVFCAKYLEPRAKAESARYERFVGAYQDFLKRCLAVRGWVVAGTAAAFVLSLLLYPRIGKELFPGADVGHLTVRLRMPTGTRIELTEAKAQEIERRLREVIEPSALKTVVTNIGVLNDWPAAYTPNSGPGDLFMEIELADERKRAAQEYADALRGFLKKNFPEVEASIDTGGMLAAALNMGLAAPIDVQVEGDKLDVSRGIADKIAARIEAVPGAADVGVQERIDYPQIAIALDRPKIARLGLTVEEVVKSVVTALNSSVNFAPAFWIDPKNGNHYFLGAQYREEQIKDLGTLKSIGITGKRQERVVPLGEIATFRETTAPSEIRHASIKRVVDVFANVSGRDVGGVASDVERLLPSQGELPQGYRVRLRGQAASMNEAFANLGFGLILAVVLVHLVLSGQFRSFLDPVLILSAVPLGLMGVLVALWATRTTFNVQSFTGVIFMVGIAVSNGILLVEFANRELERGKTPDEAVVAAAGVRLRPILMTSLATILGLIPMAVGVGRGAEADVPLARAVLGGILVSTLLVLVLVPMLYGALQRLKSGLGRPSAAALALLTLTALAGGARAQETTKLVSYEEAVAAALANNPRVLAAEARLAEAGSDVTIARAPRYPRLAASAMDSWGFGGSSQALGISGLVNSPYRKDEAIGVDLAWTLYDFGRTDYRTKAAEDAAGAARAELDRVKLDVRLALASAYVHCAQHGRLAAVFDGQIQDQRRVAQELGRYVRAGLRSPVELELVAGTLEGISARREESLARHALAIEELRELMGTDDPSPFDCRTVPAPAAAAPVGELLARALSRRPEIAAAARRAAAAEAEWKASRRDRWPVLSAVAGGGALSKASPVEKKEWSAGVGLRLPLFEGFRLRASEDKAARARKEYDLGVSATRRAVVREVRSAAAWLAGIEAASVHLDEQERRVGGAYRLARERYLAKTGTFADLRDAQNGYFKAVEEAVAARYAERLATEQLTLGAGLP